MNIKTLLTTTLLGVGIVSGSIGYGIKASNSLGRERFERLSQVYRSPELKRIQELEDKLGIDCSNIGSEVPLDKINSYVSLRKVIENPCVHEDYKCLFEEYNHLSTQSDLAKQH